MSSSLADLRRSYERALLDERDALSDPFLQFARWFEEAQRAEVPEPNAMTLATVGSSGRPSTRVVLLKGLDLDTPPPPASGRGFVWFTNYGSRKGIELAIHPHASLQFFWPELERQVRIEGLVERTAEAESDAYFASRPLGSRHGAWASAQSNVVESRAVLEARLAEVAEQFGEDVPRPSHWGGYRLVPDYFEFWQGRPSRLHDRLAYRRAPGTADWGRVRLAP